MPVESPLPNDPEPFIPSDRRPPNGGWAGARAAGEGTIPSDDAPAGASRGAPGPAPGAPRGGPADDAATGEGGSTADRIREATARGSLQGVPPAAYRDTDWTTVESANPFEVLYLDYRQPGAIGAAVLADRRDTLGKFWQEINATRERGAGTQRDRIERKYGFKVGTFTQRVENAYARLAQPGAVTQEARLLEEARRRAGEAQIAAFVDFALDDELLTRSETTRILQNGERAELTREETGDYLRRTLIAREFVWRDRPRGATIADTLLSTEWLSKKQLAREEDEARKVTEDARAQAQRIADEIARTSGPEIEIADRSARTIDEFIDLCDRYPVDARRALSNGTVKEWLQKTRKSWAVDAATERQRAHPTEPAKALELLVRDLCQRVKRAAVPIVTPQPAEFALGALPQGAERALRLEFARAGRTFIWGTASLARDLPGVRVSRTLADGLNGAHGGVEIAVDTLNTTPGEYQTTVLVDIEGGARVTVPLSFTVVPLTLIPDHPVLDLGMIPLGRKPSATVRLTLSPPGGRLVGSASLGNERDGVDLAANVQHDGATARVTVDSRLVGRDVVYTSHVRFDTNAGVVRVPVRFHVRRSADEIKQWAVVLALVGGVGMGVGREMLADPDHWQLTSGAHSHEVSLALAILVLAVLGVVVGVVVRRLQRLRTPSAVDATPSVD